MIARYKFCVWLVNRLASRRMSLKEITDEWETSASNINGARLTSRTFLRHKELAEEIFNVNIECDKSRNEYWLNTEDLDESNRWTMSALSIQNLTSMASMRRHIVLEDAPAGQQWLEDVANACRDSRALSFGYKSPYRPMRRYEVIPLFVRMFRQRWYLTCQPVGKEYLSTLALERMSDLKTGDVMEPTAKVDAEEYFSDCYGIIHQLEPERIVVRAFWPQNAYIKEVPIHHSQRVVEEDDNWTDFSLYLRPTYDFKQELLWQRDKLAVISPRWLRDDMIDILSRMAESYRTGLPNCKDE